MVAKLKASELHDIVYLHGKGRMACYDLYDGHIGRNTFIAKMIEYPYTDPALEERFEPSMVWPKLPGTREAILDWGVRVGYIDQETYDEVMKGLDNA